MPYISINNVNYFYQVYGDGPQTIVFSHGLLWSGQMFHKQVAHFKDHYRIITYDHRGQGQTDIAPDGYDMDTLYQDAVQLIERLATGPVIFGGLSMGGFVGMRLAARRPDLVSKLILMETTADPEPEQNRPRYRFLNTVVKWLGVAFVVKPVMKIMFGQKFLNDPARADERQYWIEQLKTNRPKGITRAVDGVIDRKGIADELHKVVCPTLILVGDQDVATVPEKSQKIKSLIPHAHLEIIAGGGHTASIEEAEVYNFAIERFLESNH
ncbi:MAG: alpha/beta hydrolase [Spirosomaceae bacterium]|jgi:pimeloyl-ACP methyl ester carboxylesterase|nr:alpha/beta hydrolase [Spirosomataceae bacterium]